MRGGDCREYQSQAVRAGAASQPATCKIVAITKFIGRLTASNDSKPIPCIVGENFDVPRENVKRLVLTKTVGEEKLLSP